ncbi:MAG: UvrD-helicase domain-containing protein [candidate division WOR-3 bacterium]|nr:UvrD-helicase domain-containing protein [candidate division WOR-3 bacterium]
MIRQTLGKYRILRWLGGGQFGDVYLAHDTILGMDFALKVSRMRASDVQMLKDEARLLAGLTHPNIVRFYSVDRMEGKFVLVAEYVRGESLRDRLQEGRVDIAEALGIARQTLSALAYAHEKGVIHRDLKPENILLTENGEVKVADFGLARFLKKGSLAASVAGTPFYMSPEAWSGRFMPSSDLWSVGVILYEMLTGVLPFQGANYEEIRTKLMNEAPTDPSRLRPEIPKTITDTILSLLAKDAQARPQDAGEVLGDLQTRGRRIVLPGVSAKKAPVEGVTLTAEQRDIVESAENRLLVAGAAGTGKTTLLVQRACHLARQGLSPDRLLFLAFSRRAAEEMRTRLERLLGRSLPDVWIETVHSFGWRFLRIEGWRLDLSPEFKTANPSEILDIISKKWGRNRAKALARSLADLRLAGKTLEDYPAQTPGDKQIAEFWQDYEQVKKDADAVDFDDLLIKTVRLLEADAELRDRWRSRFSHILADELQDLHPIQFKLLRLICGPDTGLFLTGDAAQSIYGWRGADPRLIEAAAKVFAPIERRELNASFRIGKELIKVADNLMAGSADSSRVPQLSLAKQSGRFEFYKASGVADEARFVVERIKSLVQEKGYRPSDFGVLYRVNSYSRAFEEALAAERIPASVIGSEPFYEREEVRYLLDILKSLRERSFAGSIRAWQWLLSLKPQTNPLIVEEGLLRLSPDAKTRSRRSIERFFASIAEWGKRADEVSPSDLLEFIAGSKVAVRRFSSSRASEVLDELKEASARFRKGELGLFLDHLALLEDLELAQWSKDAVKLLSIHSAKGLEFKVVFLVGLAEGLLPLTRSLADPEALEEERRLCYVALTRSLAELYVSVPARRFRQPTRPSRFLLQMLGLL